MKPALNPIWRKAKRYFVNIESIPLFCVIRSMLFINSSKT